MVDLVRDYSKEKNVNKIKNPYPEMILGLPQADIPFEGVKGWIMQDEKVSALFFELDPIGKVPDHSHCAQWGMVLEGKMNLTIDGKTSTYMKGDRYFIPEGIIHSAEFLTKCYVIDFFADPDRYKKKNNKEK